MSGTLATPPDRILSERQEELRQRAHGIIDDLTGAIHAFPADGEDLAILADAADRLEALFLLVFAGEFNAGKSAVINALLGESVMPEGVTPTTSTIHLLRFGAQLSETSGPDGVIEHAWPSPLLRDVNLVDTPGTNAIIREHEQLSQRFVPRADLVLFVSPADRPFTESERQFMTEIRAWGKKIIVVLNKIDILQTERELRDVLDFIRTNSVRLLGLQPRIFAVSARQARRSQSAEAPTERQRLWEESRFEELERFVVDALDEQERIRLKLLNPLGIADRIAARYRAAAANRLALLERDRQTIERINQRIDVHRSEMRADFSGYLSRVESIIHRLNARADRFFDETIRLARVFDLLDRERVQNEFREQVVADTERQIDTAVSEMIDWMVDRDLRLWQTVTDYIDRRQLDRHQGEVIGEAGSRFSYDRQTLLASVARRSSEVVARYDPHQEAAALAESVRGAVTRTAIAEAGAVGLGAIIIALATTAAADVTGVLVAVTIGGLGLVILPMRKRRARDLLHRRSRELHDQLVAALQDQFEREIERSTARVRDTLAPYVAFVQTERDRLLRLTNDLDRIDRDISDLRRLVEQ